MILTKIRRPTNAYRNKVLIVIKALYNYHNEEEPIILTLSEYFNTLNFKRGHQSIYHKIKKLCIEQQIDIVPEAFENIMHLYLKDRKKKYIY